MIKNIVLVSHDYLPNIGGIAIYTHELSKALTKRGHKVTVLTSYVSNSNAVTYEKRDGIEVYRVPYMRIKKIGDFQYRKRMSKLIIFLQENKKIDVIHWQTMHKDGKMMKKLDVKGIEVYTNHLSWFRTLYSKKDFKKIKYFIGAPDHIICPSNETREMSTSIFGESMCSFIPNGVEPKDFMIDNQEIEELRKKLAIGKNEKVLLTTNRMEPVKGMKYFVEAIPDILQENPKSMILMVGDGSEEKKLKNWLESQGTNMNKVKFLGRKTNTEVKKLLALADIYIQPSLMEGCSIALIEAMASRKPIVACNVGGNPDILEHLKTGFLIPEKNSRAIVEAIDYLLKNPQEAKCIGEQAKAKVENELNWTALAEKVDDIYNRTISEKRNGK